MSWYIMLETPCKSEGEREESHHMVQEGEQTSAQTEKAQQKIHSSAITNHCKRERDIMDRTMDRVICTEDNVYQCMDEVANGDKNTGQEDS